MKRSTKLIISIILSVLLYSCGQKRDKSVNINGIWELKSFKKPELIVVGDRMFVYFNDTTMITWAKPVGYTYPVKYQINNSKITIGIEDPFSEELNIVSQDSFLIEDSFLMYSYRRVKDITESQFFIEKNLRDRIEKGNK